MPYDCHHTHLVSVTDLQAVILMELPQRLQDDEGLLE
jgi:hypothetical protein